MLLRIVIFVLALAVTQVDAAAAESLTILHNFSPPGASGVNDDGARGSSVSAASASLIFGTTSSGGEFGRGTIFAAAKNGSGFTNIHSFAGVALDGDSPVRGPTLYSNVLYGATQRSGDAISGVIYALNPDGTDFHYVYVFSGTDDGAQPDCDLTIKDGTIYGCTWSGGFGWGTIFSVKTTGENFQALYTFTEPDSGALTNLDGVYSHGGLAIDGEMLYGVTGGGGKNGHGTIFRMRTDGSDFTVLHHFADASGDAYAAGERPIVFNGYVYGSCQFGGAHQEGAIYSVATNGSNFKLIHSFSSAAGEATQPQSLTFLGEKFYGTSPTAGGFGKGAVFRVSLTGVYETLHNATRPNSNSMNVDGFLPTGRLFVGGNNVYFATANGGSNAAGAIGRLGLNVKAPTLGIRQTQPGLEILVTGELGMDYVLEQSNVITGEWIPSGTVTINSNPEPVPFGEPDQPTFWRGLVSPGD